MNEENDNINTDIFEIRSKNRKNELPEHQIFVFDDQDWKPRIVKDSIWNEAFVDNWKITAVIAPKISHNYLRKIVHGKMNRPDVKILSPAQVGELK